MEQLSKFQHRRSVTASGSTRSDLATIVSSAKSIYVSACASEIADMADLLRRYPPRDATVTGIFSPLVNQRSYADPDINLRMRCFLLTRQIKEHMTLGLVDYCPWRYGMIDRWMGDLGRFDTAFVMVSPPDGQGMCSLGVQSDFLPSFHENVGRIVGFVNPQMPVTSGHARIPYSSFSAVVDYDVPLKTMVEKPADAISVRIADRIVNLVPDHAAVQFGVGQIPSQVLGRLSNHKGLQVHSGVIDDNVLQLVESGALDPDRPIVTGTAVGTRQFYETLSRDGRFEFRPVAYTHSQQVLASLPRFTAVNSVLQVDLLGQVSAETSGGKWLATPGGLPDFIRGALAVNGGTSVIAVRAGSIKPGVKGVVSLIDAPHAVTSPASDADVIVTEFGTAHLRGLSLDERAEAIMAVADPQDFDTLNNEWRKIRAGGFSRS